MLIVMGVISVDPGVVAGLRQAICDMQVETLKEPGCLGYDFSVSISDPGKIHIAERWESMEDLTAHFKTAHMATLNQTLGSVEILAMDVKAYDVAGELPLPAL